MRWTAATARSTRTSRPCAPSCMRWIRTQTRSARTAASAIPSPAERAVRIGLRIFLGYFAIVALAALLLARVFVAEVKPGVRQAMEDTLVDTANVLAELATDDFQAGRIAHGRFARRIEG